MERIAQSEPADARAALHGYLAYRLGAALEIPRSPVQLRLAEHRDLLRGELWAVTTEARHGVYRAPDIQTLLAEWFAEVLNDSDTPITVPLRLLVLLADFPTSGVVGFVGPAFAKLMPARWDAPRLLLARRMATGIVNQFSLAAGPSELDLEKFTPSEWSLVSAPWKLGAAASCGTAIAAATPEKKRRFWPLRWGSGN